MSFVRRNEERTVKKGKVFGGDGEVEMRQIINSVDELSGKGRLFNHTYLEPGAEIGWHVHNGDGELYYILKGTALYSDNGTPVTLHAGDVTCVYSGEGHSMKNIGDDILESIALILYS